MELKVYIFLYFKTAFNKKNKFYRIKMKEYQFLTINAERERERELYSLKEPTNHCLTRKQEKTTTAL